LKHFKAINNKTGSTMIWKMQPSIEALNALGHNSLGEHLGIYFTEIGDDYLIACMPVDHRTVQPYRVLHGGASVALAETLGSVASTMCIDLSKYKAVGVEINANHLSSAREGTLVYGKVYPIRIGRTLQVWGIDITDEKGKKICISRLTVAVIDN
jgi:1,4-dihydroxy-2-naphthoyl-CoA hydrolase